MVQFSVRVSQSFLWKELDGWVGQNNPSERIVKDQICMDLGMGEWGLRNAFAEGIEKNLYRILDHLLLPSYEIAFVDFI